MPEVGPHVEEFDFDEPAQWTAPEVLVAVPTSDAVVVAALAVKPRKLVLLATGGQTALWWTKIRAWFRARGDAPSIAEPPDPDEPALTEDNLVSALQAALGRTDPRKVAVLVTTGTSWQTSLLTQFAHASGGEVVHVVVQYDEAGKPDLSRRRTVVGLGLPALTQELYALRRARSLARGGAPRVAVGVLEGLPHKSDLAQATEAWLQGVAEREALRFSEAYDALDRAQRILRETAPSSAQIKALRSCVDPAVEAVRSLLTGDPIHVVAELVHLARRETQLGRTNHAALLWYRSAEAIVALRLERDFRIEVARGTSQLDGAVVDRVHAIARAVRGEAALVDLARPIGLLTGLMLLAALDVLGGADDALARVRRFERVLRARNRSIFAHGFEQVRPEDLEEWSALVEPLTALVEPREAWGRAHGTHGFRFVTEQGDEVVHDTRPR